MTNKIYHIPFSTDAEAAAAFWELGPKISIARGYRHISPSQGNGRAFLVVELPEGVDANEVTHPHTANEVIQALVEDAHQGELEDDDDVPFDDEDEEDDDPSSYWDEEDDEFYDDEEDEVDEPKEDSGNQPGEDRGEASPVEGPASGEATTLGSSEVSPE